MNKLSLFNMLVAHFNNTSFFDYFYNTLKKIYYSNIHFKINKYIVLLILLYFYSLIIR